MEETWRDWMGEDMRQRGVTFTKASAIYLSNQRLSSHVRTEFESQDLQQAAQSPLTLEPACTLARKGGMLVEENCRHGWPSRALIEGDPLSISLLNMIIGGEPISSS
ncbi:hypothetical protein NC652_001360 [Populus alba x Populus x berolinensis]|nr:hypothetical protein NC652_001360 [Populus alba x Populus x berolinensis]